MVEYIKPNGTTSKYEVKEFDGISFSYDMSEPLWAERYRPRIINDLILPQHIENTVKEIIKTKSIPNLLFYSATGGTGKDSIINVLSAQLDVTMLTINASLERGIDVIKNKVTNFAVSNSVDGTHKVLYLTEAGGLTNLALDSLKSLIEEHSSRVSFIMTTNSMNNITHALQSRFQYFDMNTLPVEERKELAIKTYKRIIAILKNENIDFDPRDVQVLMKRYFPSFRELMFALQQNVHNKKLEITKDETVSLLNDVIKYINNGNYQSLVSISEKINYTNFSIEMNNRLSQGLLKDLSYIPGFIDALNRFQDSIVKRVPFLNISFLVFCNELIKSGIKLNELE